MFADSFKLLKCVYLGGKWFVLLLQMVKWHSQQQPTVHSCIYPQNSHAISQPTNQSTISNIHESSGKIWSKVGTNVYNEILLNQPKHHLEIDWVIIITFARWKMFIFFPRSISALAKLVLSIQYYPTCETPICLPSYSCLWRGKQRVYFIIYQ